MTDEAPEEDVKEFNVLNHESVPIHEVLDDKETSTLYEDLKITADQLPKIYASDPAARAVHAQAGQVLRIRRKSKTAGEAVAYRLVIEYQV